VEQLTFELAPAEPPSFANFLAGRNAEVVAALHRLADGGTNETGVLLWGPAGAGRTHLLQATVARAAHAQRPVEFHPTPHAVAAEPRAPGMLVAVDDVDAADAGTQGRLFTLFNALRDSGGQLLVAANVPPGRLALRDDLRTRLGWGLVYEIAPLTDGDKPAALAHYAMGRGFLLTDDVIAYLLAHGRRDMTTLMATLAALDRHSLATKRPITVPLLRSWLQREMVLAPATPVPVPPEDDGPLRQH
jgi:DnaA family protein